MNEAPEKPVIQALTRRQIREAAALRANLLKRKDQSRLREAAKDLPDPDQGGTAVVKDSA